MRSFNPIIDRGESEKLFIFSGETIPSEDDEKTPEAARIRIYPYALSWVSEPTRPVLLFNDKDKKITVPVAMSHLEAGIAVAQNSPHVAETNPHRVLDAILGALDVEIKECLFTEVRGHYQYAALSFESRGQGLKQLHLRADEVVTAALAFKIPFYTSPQFVQSSRVMSTDMEALGRDPELQIQILNRPGKYLM